MLFIFIKTIQSLQYKRHLRRNSCLKPEMQSLLPPLQKNLKLKYQEYFVFKVRAKT